MSNCVVNLSWTNIVAQFVLAVFLVGLASFATPAYAAKIVRWVDADGAIHFGNAPPPSELNAEEISVKQTNRIAVPTSRLGNRVNHDINASTLNNGNSTASGVVLKNAARKLANPTSPNNGKSARRSR